MILEISQKSEENTCTKVPLLIKLQASACNFILKEILAQVFSCEFCEISKKSFLTEHLWATASGKTLFYRTFQSVLVPLALKEYDGGYSYIAGFGTLTKQIKWLDMKEM